MASLASLSAKEIITLASDGDVEDKEKLQESKFDFQAAAVDEEKTQDTIDDMKAFRIGETRKDVPFCISGMTTHSYGLSNDMNSGGMIMYMDGKSV